ncbi:MAG: Holliday junction branch migration DNA helicase RuvB [candidate division Zixibacteria bacterium 4484_93]|nr:MAG: Holliday junction branch migration DNA helicase RuvB [candidate division Zixibacteria bacterium 4484_93]
MRECKEFLQNTAYFFAGEGNILSELLSSEREPEEIQFEEQLRPSRLSDFVGQSRVKEKLSIFIEAARVRDEALDHCLFYGPSGLGKTTLAHIIANELGVSCCSTSGPALEKPGDLAGILTSLSDGDVLFIDEVHRLPRAVEEYLYSAMEDFSLDIVLERGPGARSVRLSLPHFTLAAATTRAGLLTPPFRSRFGIAERLDYYPPEDIHRILVRSARILSVGLTEAAGAEIAGRSRGTPRIANRLLRRVRDFALVRSDGRITKTVAKDALSLFEIDEFGLDEMDKRILTTIIEKFSGGPVGLSTIAVSVGEDAGTIEEVYEPYLILVGFIARTPRGRVATPLAYKHLGKSPGSTMLFK